MLKKTLIYSLFFCCLIFLTGCFSMVGYGLGTVVDDNKSGEHYTINEDLYGITPETEIQLITITNDTLAGLYIKTTNEYSDEYISEYNERYNHINEKFIIPVIGDTLLISNPLGDIYKYIFLGFDYNKIYVKSALSSKYLFINLNTNAKIIIKNNQFLNQDYIKNGFEYKLIPIMSKLHLKNTSDSLSVYYHKIQNIQTDSSNKARYLTLIGLGIDLFFWYNLERSGHGYKFKWD